MLESPAYSHTNDHWRQAPRRSSGEAYSYGWGRRTSAAALASRSWRSAARWASPFAASASTVACSKLISVWAKGQSGLASWMSSKRRSWDMRLANSLAIQQFWRYFPPPFLNNNGRRQSQIAHANSKYQNASKTMRAIISLAAFLVVGLAACWFSRRWMTGPPDGCTVRRLLACTITLLGTVCFVDMARRIGRAASHSSLGVCRISHSASRFPSAQRYESAAC